MLVSITTIDPNIKNSYNEQASVQIERELSPSTSLSVGYLHTRGLHLILSRNVNVPTVSRFGRCAESRPSRSALRECQSL